MTRQEIRELAAFQADENKGAYALSFYFQPDPPRDRSHRGEGILAKDVVKQALKNANGKARNGCLHADLDRVLEVASRLPGHTRGRAVYAGTGYLRLFGSQSVEGVRSTAAARDHRNLRSASPSTEASGDAAGCATRLVCGRGRSAAGAVL